MSCVFPHIVRDVFTNSQNKHHIQVNTVMKSLFDGSSEKELHETLDTKNKSIIRRILLTVINFLKLTIKV